MEIFTTQLLNGVIVGSLYAIIALGLTLTFGITGIVNFAFGEFMMIGAYLTWYFTDKVGLPYGFSVVLAALSAGLCGAVADQLFFRHTRNNLINGLLVSVGLTLVIQSIVLLLWSATPRQLSYVMTGSVTVAGISLSSMKLVVFAVLMVLILATYAGLLRTWLGRAAYAFSQNGEAAMLMGVRTQVVQSGIVIYSTMLAGFGGALYASLYTMEPTSGGVYMLKGIEAAILGGIGSMPGALLGGLILGVTEALGSTYLSSAYRDAYGLIFVVAILLVRPSGLLSKGR